LYQETINEKTLKFCIQSTYNLITKNKIYQFNHFIITINYLHTMKTFKVQFLLIALAFVTVFSACKKDDENNVKPKSTAEKVLGKWNIKKTTIRTYIDDELIDTEEDNGVAGDYVEFNNNKTYVSFTKDDGLDSGSYEVLNESSMTITMDGDKLTVKVDKLDEKEFTFTSTFSETTDDGYNIKVVATFELAK
jgi:hypothetical protein